MSLPWMRLNIGEYLVHTMHLSAAGHGAYLLLIIHYWQHGNLPHDDRELASIARLPKTRWRKIRPTIEAFFEPGWRLLWVDEARRSADAAYARRVERMRQLDERRLPPAEWSATRLRIFTRDNFTCAYCGERGGSLQCDHVVPIARGGGNEDENLTTACADCNKSKGTQLVEEWVRA